MKKILDNIVAHKKKEVAALQKQRSLSALEHTLHFNRQPLSLRNNIFKTGLWGIIAEYKRQSPSRGVINNHADVLSTTLGYQNAGASGVSILTDKDFFGGTHQDIERVRPHLTIPILRKDFIIHEYQIVEAKAIGADCILLIGACLSKQDISHFARLAHDLGLEVLYEIHEANELDKLNDNIDMVGINNRNLQNFEVNLDHSIQLLNRIPKTYTKIAESGISSVADYHQLQMQGFEGFLMGEVFMRHKHPEEALREFIQQL